MALPTYSAFTKPYRGIIREIITECGISVPIDGNVVVNDSRIHTSKALWDTGATNSAITPRLINDLSLKAIGKTNVVFGGGKSIADLFLVDLFLPNRVQFPKVLVTECSDETGKHEDGTVYFDIIIGMDIISSGDFALSNKSGNSKFTFLSPSNHNFDFVQELIEQNKKLFDKSGRNDKCPCGSGKKYKDCHWPILHP